MRVHVNNTKMRSFNVAYPGRCGFLITPPRPRITLDLPYGIDNGMYATWLKGRQFDEEGFLGLLDQCIDQPQQPEWVVVPDAIGDCYETLRLWQLWEPRLRQYGWKLAMAVQDGMDPETLPVTPDWIFVGGTTEWKWRTVWKWCRYFPRVHVGRVNSERRLWQCDMAGVKSVDGSGWFRGDQRQPKQLARYFKRSSEGLSQPQKYFEFAQSDEQDATRQGTTRRA